MLFCVHFTHGIFYTLTAELIRCKNKISEDRGETQQCILKETSTLGPTAWKTWNSLLSYQGVIRP